MAKHHPDHSGSALTDAEKQASRLVALTKRVTHLEKERIEMNQALQGLVDKLKMLEELAQHTAEQLHQGGGGGGGVSPSDVQELEGYADRATQTLNDALQGDGGDDGNQGGNQQQPPPPQQQPPPPQQQPQQKPTPAQMAAQILGRGKGKVSP